MVGIFLNHREKMGLNGGVRYRTCSARDVTHRFDFFLPDHAIRNVPLNQHKI
jgi:hypothetical protein